jgi:hypothetical protein
MSKHTVSRLLACLTAVELCARSLAVAQPTNTDANPVAQRVAESALVLAVPRVTTPPRFPDLLNGTIPEAVIVSDFRQREPGDGSAASQTTQTFVSYDDKNLYIIFRCEDDGQGIRAHLAKREEIGNDDQVLVYLDTFRDRRRAYVFGVNPLGVQRDGILTEGQGTDYSFDAIWASEAQLTDRGFTVFITIPFKSLRFSSSQSQTWGIALGRYLPRNSEYSYWPYITNRVSGFVNQMAELQNVANVSTKRNVQLIPYGAFTTSRFLDPDMPAFRRLDDGQAGLDAKVVMRDAFTLDVTLNPDFSQVESDEPQVTVNQRFEVFFREKRPFFIENAGFFNTPENLFFSRRIVDPRFGGRLTGKSGGWVIGALAADDLPDGGGFFDSTGSRTTAVVGRVQREIGRESFVGVLATDRHAESGQDTTLALDTRLRLDSNWTLTSQIIRTATETSDDREPLGSGFNATLARAGRHFTYSGLYLDRSPTFRAPLGFIRRVDIRETDHSLGYLWRPANGRLFAFGPVGSASVIWDYQGRLQDWFGVAGANFYFKGPWDLRLFRTETYEAFGGLEFRHYENAVSFSAARTKQLMLNSAVTFGVRPNYTPAEGVAPYLANARDLSIGVSYRPVQRVRIDQSYFYSQLDTRSPVVTATGAFSGNIFHDHISRTKLNLQFTKSLSLRAIVDAHALIPNSSLVAEDLSKRIIPDVLLTYLLNPFTAFYLGYTERYQNVDLDDSSPARLQILESPSTLTARQLFTKISYRFGF